MVINRTPAFQALTGLICTMIESCPSSQSHQSTLSAYKNHTYNMNNMVKMMLKRGIVTDLARVPHSLDLSSPNVSATINAVLKPLETLSRIVNQPSPIATARYNHLNVFFFLCEIRVLPRVTRGRCYDSNFLQKKIGENIFKIFYIGPRLGEFTLKG
jgi:hypothetical protein